MAVGVFNIHFYELKCMHAVTISTHHVVEQFLLNARFPRFAQQPVNICRFLVIFDHIVRIKRFDLLYKFIQILSPLIDLHGMPRCAASCDTGRSAIAAQSMYSNTNGCTRLGKCDSRVPQFHKESYVVGEYDDLPRQPLSREASSDLPCKHMVKG